MVIAALVLLCGMVMGQEVRQCHDWQGQPVLEGARYTPNKDDPCTTCLCNQGFPVACATPVCAEPHCSTYELLQGSCCEYHCIEPPIHPVGGNSSDGYPHSTPIPSESIPVDSADTGLRLVASTVTSLLILALLMFMIHRLRRRRMLIMMRRFSSEQNLPEDDSAAYIADQIDVQCPPYEDPPPPYTPPKPPGPEDFPPPYQFYQNNNEGDEVAIQNTVNSGTNTPGQPISANNRLNTINASTQDTATQHNADTTNIENRDTSVIQDNTRVIASHVSNATTHSREMPRTSCDAGSIYSSSTLDSSFSSQSTLPMGYRSNVPTRIQYIMTSDQEAHRSEEPISDTTNESISAPADGLSRGVRNSSFRLSVENGCILPVPSIHGRDVRNINVDAADDCTDGRPVGRQGNVRPLQYFPSFNSQTSTDTDGCSTCNLSASMDHSVMSRHLDNISTTTNTTDNDVYNSNVLRMGDTMRSLPEYSGLVKSPDSAGVDTNRLPTVSERLSSLPNRTRNSPEACSSSRSLSPCQSVFSVCSETGERRRTRHIVPNDAPYPSNSTEPQFIPPVVEAACAKNVNISGSSSASSVNSSPEHIEHIAHVHLSTEPDNIEGATGRTSQPANESVDQSQNNTTKRTSRLKNRIRRSNSKGSRVENIRTGRSPERIRVTVPKDPTFKQYGFIDNPDVLIQNSNNGVTYRDRSKSRERSKSQDRKSGIKRSNSPDRRKSRRSSGHNYESLPGNSSPQNSSPIHRSQSRGDAPPNGNTSNTTISHATPSQNVGTSRPIEQLGEGNNALRSQNDFPNNLPINSSTSIGHSSPYNDSYV